MHRFLNALSHYRHSSQKITGIADGKIFNINIELVRKLKVYSYHPVCLPYYLRGKPPAQRIRWLSGISVNKLKNRRCRTINRKSSYTGFIYDLSVKRLK